MIPTIHLPRQKIKKFKLEDGREFMLCLNATSINHFQTVNKKGFLKFYEELQNSKAEGGAPIYETIQLLASCVKYPTGQPVGMKFFKDYDDFEIAAIFGPMLSELFAGNLPAPKDDSEKK